MITPREMFELIEDLCNEYGIDEVEKTIILLKDTE